MRPERSSRAIARYEGKRTGAPGLVVGSHRTVRNVGRCYGDRRAPAALAVVEALAAAGERLEHAVEIGDKRACAIAEPQRFARA